MTADDVVVVAECDDVLGFIDDAAAADAAVVVDIDVSGAVLLREVITYIFEHEKLQIETNQNRNAY